MNEQEIRRRISKDLEKELNKPSKPMMFIPKPAPKAEPLNSDLGIKINGIGFLNSLDVVKNEPEVTLQEIYSIKELICSNPESMATIAYDEKILRASMELAKRRDWQDILFADVDWNMKIDIIANLKKLLKF